jgi:hypothetical protein
MTPQRQGVQAECGIASRNKAPTLPSLDLGHRRQGGTRFPDAPRLGVPLAEDDMRKAESDGA